MRLAKVDVSVGYNGSGHVGIHLPFAIRANSSTMRRHLLGILAITLIAVGLSYMPFDRTGFLANSCWRIGLVLSALWLAMPQLEEMALWFRRAAIVIAILAAALSKYGLILLPLIFFMWIFSGKKSRPQDSAKTSGEKVERTSQST